MLLDLELILMQTALRFYILLPGVCGLWEHYDEDLLKPLVSRTRSCSVELLFVMVFMETGRPPRWYSRVSRGPVGSVSSQRWDCYFVCGRCTGRALDEAVKEARWVCLL
jgi:hypothetical protein